MNNLNPCPFCNSNVSIDLKDDWYVFNCTYCECRYQTTFGETSAETRDLAIQEWNTRPVEDELRISLTAVQDYLREMTKQRYDQGNEIRRLRKTENNLVNEIDELHRRIFYLESEIERLKK